MDKFKRQRVMAFLTAAILVVAALGVLILTTGAAPAPTTKPIVIGYSNNDVARAAASVCASILHNKGYRATFTTMDAWHEPADIGFVVNKKNKVVMIVDKPDPNDWWVADVKSIRWNTIPFSILSEWVPEAGIEESTRFFLAKYKEEIYAAMR